MPTLTSCAVSWSRALRLPNSLAACPAAARAPLASGKRPRQGRPASQAELLSRGHSSPWQRAGVHGSSRAPPHTWAGREQLELGSARLETPRCPWGANTAPQGLQTRPGQPATAELELQELRGHREGAQRALLMCHCRRRAARAGCPHLSQRHQVSIASSARAGAETGAKQEPKPSGSQ